MIDISKIIDEEVKNDGPLKLDDVEIGNTVNNNILLYPYTDIKILSHFFENTQKFDEKNIKICIDLMDSHNTPHINYFILSHIMGSLKGFEYINEDIINTMIYNTIDLCEIELLDTHKDICTIYAYQKRKNILKELL